MKERPILFTGPMVRAILEGHKTQTRRIVKLPVKDPLFGCEIAGCELNGLFKDCPQVSRYGQPGDRLWVRETWAKNDGDVLAGKAHYSADGTMVERWQPSIFMPRWASRLTLEITGVRVEHLQDISEADAKAEGTEPYAPYDGRYREGYRILWESINARPRPNLPSNTASRRYARVKRWLETHPDNSWNTNPWVWVIEFKRIS